MTDSELIDFFLGNDKEKSHNAFGLLYYRYQRMLLDRLYRKIGDEEEVKDCSQKIWLKLVEKLKNHTAVADEKGCIGGLLVKMANDQVADYFRREGRVKPEPLLCINADGEIVEKEFTDSGASSRERVLRREQLSIINKALEYFTKKDRSIFWGLVRGETVEVISRQTGYTEATVRKKFSIQKLRVRHFLSANGYAYGRFIVHC